MNKTTGENVTDVTRHNLYTCILIFKCVVSNGIQKTITAKIYTMYLISLLLIIYRLLYDHFDIILLISPRFPISARGAEGPEG